MDHATLCCTKIDGDTSHMLDEYRHRHQTMIDSAVFEPVIEGLYQTVEKGTAAASKIKGYDVCGKTGTAQNPFGKNHSIFVAFMPRQDPKIAISVFIENSGFGATYAAPIASLIMEKYVTGTVAESRLAVEKKMMETDLIHANNHEKKSEHTE